MSDVTEFLGFHDHTSPEKMQPFGFQSQITRCETCMQEAYKALLVEHPEYFTIKNRRLKAGMWAVGRRWIEERAPEVECVCVGHDVKTPLSAPYDCSCDEVRETHLCLSHFERALLVFHTSSLRPAQEGMVTFQTTATR